MAAIANASSAASARLAVDAIRTLQAHGHLAYLVGGCVRDQLLGRTPDDFDIATSAHPPHIQALFPDAHPVGASFGVMLLRRHDAEVQMATFRSEGAYQDGRHPTRLEFVHHPSLDALRRDFTINALFQDPISGELLDFHGGRQDLQDGLLRAVGQPARRFAEDHLRMLRAVRFAARLGFAIHAETANAIRAQAASIQHISQERIRDELVRILTEGHPRRGFELLDELSLLAQILPEAKAMQGVQQPPEFHPEGDVWTHTMLMLDALQQPSLTVALGVLFHDIGKPETQTITDRIRFHGHVEAGERIAHAVMARLRFSQDQIEQVVALVANHMKFMHLREMRQSTRKRFLRLPAFEEHMELHRVDCLSSHRKLGNYQYARELLETLSTQELRPQPLLNGGDLIALGYQPGPRFGEILHAMEDQQLEGRLLTREDALTWLRETYPVQA
ncbi:MAG: CCA tRNA nucleotidyltransferase [Bryobacterales bacterium]|jgi:poly(A) polymerase|nr:CCA tRNA nucleotidyltransferase [Bryobacterales bacterium]